MQKSKKKWEKPVRDLHERPVIAMRMESCKPANLQKTDNTPLQDFNRKDTTIRQMDQEESRGIELTLAAGQSERQGFASFSSLGDTPHD
jgi:hypothetical protein